MYFKTLIMFANQILITKNIELKEGAFRQDTLPGSRRYGAYNDAAQTRPSP